MKIRTAVIATMLIAACTASASAKELTPQQLEVKQLSAQLKEKRAALKEAGKAERREKAEKAVLKAQQRLAKLS